jgi:hypothetical protein
MIRSDAAEINSNSRDVILVLRVTARRARPFNFRVVTGSTLVRIVIGLPQRRGLLA